MGTMTHTPLDRRAFITALTITPMMIALASCADGDDDATTDVDGATATDGSVENPLEGVSVDVWRDPG